jgi:methyl-accepting chemotaxis protein
VLQLDQPSPFDCACYYCRRRGRLLFHYLFKRKLNHIQGDLTRKIEIEVEGEMLTLKNTVNSMVDQLSTFASEVTRVALEVGSMGILGGQAQVEGVKGTWADLTRNVNVSQSCFSLDSV